VSLRPLHFYSIFYNRRVYGSSGIDLVGFRFRLSYARWRNRCSDSNSNSIMANPGLLCKLRRRSLHTEMTVTSAVILCKATEPQLPAVLTPILYVK